MPLLDSLHRPLRDLRISITDRCNFRCTYCMPRDVFGPNYAFLPRTEILSFEEITRLAGIFATLGVEKIRVTGGEPLLRRDVEKLIAMLAAVPGVRDLTLTTNGSLLAQKARALREAGLHRLTVSLDSLDESVSRQMNDGTHSPADVLNGIEAALSAGFRPIKINMVVCRGVNEDSVLPMAARFRGPDTILRFIEYMDVGNSNGWRMRDVVSAADLLARIDAEFPLLAEPPRYPGEVASRYGYADGQGEIGVIASVTQPFCRDCSRARLSSDGKLHTCLFATTGLDLRHALRNGSSDETIAQQIRQNWLLRGDRYSELRAETQETRRKVEMSTIGG